jgi:hypothetical protein
VDLRNQIKQNQNIKADQSNQEPLQRSIKEISIRKAKKNGCGRVKRKRKRPLNKENWLRSNTA